MTALAALRERLAELEDLKARLARLEAIETRLPRVAAVPDRTRELWLRWGGRAREVLSWRRAAPAARVSVGV